ncbi:MAG: septal ring lytic transglycosylase RlpA family protein [Thiobacillus sp.]
MFAKTTGLIYACAVLGLSGCATYSAPPKKTVAAPASRTTAPAAPTSPEATPASAKKGGYYLDDGPEAILPPNLNEISDAVPRVEPLHPFANRTYVALGQTYTPETRIKSYQKEGMASWYGKRFHGRKTASGEIYDMYGMTAAHPTLPIPSYVRVTSLANGKSVIVRVNDRGPFSKNRLIDLSYVAAHKLDYIGAGSTLVRVETVDPSQYDVSGAPLESGIYLQLGAFKAEEKAQKLREIVEKNIESPAPPVKVVLMGSLHRVTLGPYGSHEAADTDSLRLQENLGMSSIKVER